MEGADFSPHLPRQPIAQRTERHSSVEGDFDLGISARHIYHRGAGIELSQIVLGLMCPVGPSRGGKSQNEAKSRRFGIDRPSRAFYEGVNPKTILNNCHQLCFNRHRRRHRGARQPKSALCHRWSSLLECFVTHQDNRKGQHRVEKCHRGIVIALCQNVW